MCIIHKWDKWVDIEDTISAFNNTHQYRECKKCGIKEKRHF